jgi:Tfp pilus assembly protein PilE
LIVYAEENIEHCIARRNRIAMTLVATQRGISLLEVIIVFAITAVLVAISMPNFHDYTTRARVVEALDQAAPAQSALVRACMKDEHAIVDSNADAAYVHRVTNPDHDFIDRVVLAADCGERNLVVMVWTYNTGAQPDPVIEWTAEVPSGVTAEGFEPPYGWHCRLIRGEFAHVPPECRKRYRKS